MEINTVTRTPQVSIVVPTFREEANIAELTTRLFAAMDNANFTTELIIVDDNSCDGTIQLCQTMASQYNVQLITRTEERGLATAVICGLRAAQGQYVIVMDADLSHPPESVPDLLVPLQSGTSNFVIGSRYVDGGSVDETWGLFRQLNSRVAGWLAAGLTSAKDPMAGFFALRRTQLGDMSNLNPCGYKIGLEVMIRRGCDQIAEVPIHFEDRKHGESKLNLREQWLYIQHLFRLYAFRYPELFRIATFGTVGVSGMIVDLATFHALLSVLGLAAGRAVAIWVAMTWNFELNRRVTFREPRGSHPLSEYIRFCAACMLGAGLSWVTSIGLMTVATTFQARPIAAAMIGTAIAAVVNYGLCRLWVFGKRRALPKLSVVPAAYTATPMAQHKTAA